MYSPSCRDFEDYDYLLIKHNLFKGLCANISQAVLRYPGMMQRDLDVDHHSLDNEFENLENQRTTYLYDDAHRTITAQPREVAPHAVDVEPASQGLEEFVSVPVHNARLQESTRVSLQVLRDSRCGTEAADATTANRGGGEASISGAIHQSELCEAWQDDPRETFRDPVVGIEKRSQSPEPESLRRRNRLTRHRLAASMSAQKPVQSSLPGLVRPCVRILVI